MLEKTLDYSSQAYEFNQEVLKLGTRDNLFDKFMKKNKLPADDLSDFMQAVIDDIKKRFYLS